MDTRMLPFCSIIINEVHYLNLLKSGKLLWYLCFHCIPGVPKWPWKNNTLILGAASAKMLTIPVPCISQFFWTFAPAPNTFCDNMPSYHEIKSLVNQELEGKFLGSWKWNFVIRLMMDQAAGKLEQVLVERSSGAPAGGFHCITWQLVENVASPGA